MASREFTKAADHTVTATKQGDTNGYGKEKGSQSVQVE